MRILSHGEAAGFTVSAVVISLCAMGGYMRQQYAQQDIEVSKAKAAAVESMATTGKTGDEINAMLERWYSSGELKTGTVSNKRAELATTLANNKMSGDDIAKVVKACYTSDDSNKSKKTSAD